MSTAVAVTVAVLTLVGYLRWLRVAQREHYAPGRLVAMAVIWSRVAPVNVLVLGLVVAFAVAGLFLPYVGLVAAALWLVWPLRLALVSRTSKLVFTGRVKRLTAILVVNYAAASVLLALVDAASLLPLLALPLAELSLLVAQPLETALGKRFQVSAAARIREVAPRVVAITGSYGKTSTKNYAAHLMSGRWSVLASPASFNNVMGLSRAVNDRLQPGTDVFVAEMGTYGPGEIAALCETFPPEVSAIVTIGEAHLERMKDRATIVRAKSEILPPARTVVLNVDVPELAAAADQLAATKRVIRCSVQPDSDADVVVHRGDSVWQVRIDGTSYDVALPPETGHPINVAIATGLAIAVDVPTQTIVDRLASVPSTPHRAETSRLPNGLTLIDDTYNSNPDGAAQALASARALVGAGAKVWTITPGMVELGTAQAERNAELAKAATAEDWMRLCIVGRTNRAALTRGTTGMPGEVLTFPSREHAVQHVMAAADAGDVVLYENDLPDHYP